MTTGKIIIAYAGLLFMMLIAVPFGTLTAALIWHLITANEGREPDPEEEDIRNDLDFDDIANMENPEKPDTI